MNAKAQALRLAAIVYYLLVGAVCFRVAMAMESEADPATGARKLLYCAATFAVFVESIYRVTRLARRLHSPEGPRR